MARPGWPIHGESESEDEAGLSLSSRLDQLEQRAAGGCGRDQDYGFVRAGKAVEAEREGIRREEQRKGRADRVLRVLEHVEPDNEVAGDGPLEVDAQKETRAWMASVGT
jgi:hypothetical protein